MRWERDLPQFIRKLRNQHVHYAQTMRILLEPITTEFELADMLSDPAGAQLWKDKQMAGKLQDKLQDSYFAYQSTIADIERIAKKIASKLDLDRAAEVCAPIPRPRYSGSCYEAEAKRPRSYARGKSKEEQRQIRAAEARPVWDEQEVNQGTVARARRLQQGARALYRQEREDRDLS
jgi:hypothetical protein